MTSNGTRAAVQITSVSLNNGQLITVFDSATVSGDSYCTVNGSGTDCASLFNAGADTFALDRPILDNDDGPNADWEWGISTTHTMTGTTDDVFQFSGGPMAIWVRELSSNRLSFYYGRSSNKITFTSTADLLTTGQLYQISITYDGGTTGQNSDTASHDAYESRFQITIAAITEPGAPRSLSATSGDGQVALSWNAPTSNGNSAITDYGVQFSSDGGTSWSTFDDGVSTSTSTTVTGLSNGTEYTFRVSATNEIGTGNPSSTAVATPATTPGKPTGLSTTSGDGQVELSWTAPADNGGKTITGYTVEKNCADSGWSPATTTSGATSATVTSLTNGVSCDFRVSATNSVGTGDPSDAETATPAAVPDKPTLSATSGDGQVELSWTAPADNGSSITDYGVQFSSDGGTSWSTFDDGVSTSTSATVTGLSNGTEYTFRVAATNSVGTGDPSDTNTVTPAAVPDQPMLSATPGNQQVELSWTAPADNGSLITDYTVTVSPPHGNCTPVVTSCTVDGLANGTGYTFTVTATNGVGDGPASDPVTATPVAVPDTTTPTSTFALDPDLDGDGLTGTQEDEIGTDPDNPDTDGDGLDDGDEVARGTDPLDGDTDGDGFSDGTEVNELGSDPLDPDDPGADADADGLPDATEREIGTDPENPDTDGDGFDDLTEVNRGTDPLDPNDPGVDCDSDRFADSEELEYGTDPCDPDTDDDGVIDGDEVDAGTDPLDSDSDNDGLDDGEEAELGTDPNADDTDGDGLGDGDEASLGTDPLDADSDDDGMSDGEEVNQLGSDPLDPGLGFTREAILDRIESSPDDDIEVDRDSGSSFPLWMLLLAAPALIGVLVVARKRKPHCLHCGKALTDTDGSLLDPDGSAGCPVNPDGDHHETAGTDKSLATTESPPGGRAGEI